MTNLSCKTILNLLIFLLKCKDPKKTLYSVSFAANSIGKNSSGQFTQNINSTHEFSFLNSI